MRIPLYMLAAFMIMAGCSAPPKERRADFYQLDTIPLPKGLTGEVGGMDFMPDGRLAVCFHRGEVMLYDPERKAWTVFAEGLHDPLGLHVINNSEVLVMQRPELTRLVDSDGNGRADQYLVETADFGMSGNYHEFSYGPLPAPDGSHFISLNTASNGDGIWDEVRGTFNPLGRPGRMYACVPYRGWVMRLDPQGKLQPHASGFRSPNGLAWNNEGELFVTDNQGDWLGTSKLYHVEKGKFYGHVSSLVWREDWDEGVDPLTLPVAKLDSMRTKAAVLFPHNIMSNSPTQPLLIPQGSDFGPFAGQFLVGEMNRPRIMRVMLEKVKGQYQGACINFLDSAGLTIGNNRMVFGPDGNLWIGKSKYVWAGDQGIQRIRFAGGTPMEIHRVNLEADGFTIHFTRPVSGNAADLEYYRIQRYFYAYHRKYGSPRMDQAEVAVISATLSTDKRSVRIKLPPLKKEYVYDITLNNMTSESGIPLVNKRLYYFTRNLLDGEKNNIAQK